MRISESTRIATWSLSSGLLLFLVGYGLIDSLPLGAVLGFVAACLVGIVRYFFVPAGYGDVLRALDSPRWRTRSEISIVILRERRIPIGQFRGVVGLISIRLEQLERDGYLERQARYDPSELTSGCPETEYRLTPDQTPTHLFGDSLRRVRSPAASRLSLTDQTEGFFII